MNKTIMHKEILEIPESIKLTKDYNENIVLELAKTIKEKKINNIIIVARGSSDNVGVYLKYLMEIYCHIPVNLAACSVVTKYNSYLNLKNTLVIAISQSGMGEDVCEYIKMANKNGAITASITNNLDSICAKQSSFKMYLNLSEEKGLAATKTFISQMYIALMLVNAINQDNDFKDEMFSLPKLIQKIINTEDEIIEQARKCVDFVDCYFLSRGINYVSSLEATIKMQETTYIKAKAYAISDFYHGPMAISDDKQNFFILASKGKTEEDNHKIFEKLKDVGANIFVIGNDPYFKNLNKIINIPDCVEAVSPILIVVAIQLLTCNLSVLRGIDTDAPRLLKKVTVTR